MKKSNWQKNSMFYEHLEKLANTLDNHSITYMIIGGQAVLLYGEPRLTKDIDVTIDLKPEDISDIREIIDDLGLKILVDSPEKFVERTMVLPTIYPETGIRVDFIFSFSIYENQALKHVKRVKIGETNVCFASVEDLIIHKIIAGRSRDIDDVIKIIIKNADIDVPYIREWLIQFDESLSQSYLKTFEKLREQSK